MGLVTTTNENGEPVLMHTGQIEAPCCDCAAEAARLRGQLAGRKGLAEGSALIIKQLEQTIAEQAARLKAAEEALTKCRDVFNHYAQLHRAKLAGAAPNEIDGIQAKVLANAAMAANCDQVLATLTNTRAA
jgi:excinuclease UvrABC nuclease subunit